MPAATRILGARSWAAVVTLVASVGWMLAAGANPAAAAISTSMTMSPSGTVSIAAGASQSFTATVTSTAGHPTGTVDFVRTSPTGAVTDVTVGLDPSPSDPNSSVAVLGPVQFNGSGTWSVKATYNTDNPFFGYAGGETTTTYVSVGAAPLPHPDTVSLTLNPDPPTQGTDVTFNVHVAPSDGTTGVPTGTVTIKGSNTSDSSQQFTLTSSDYTNGIIPLDANGNASITVNGFAQADYSFVVLFTSSDPATYQSGSVTSLVSVKASTQTFQTQTAVQLSPTAITSGQQVTMQATVTQQGAQTSPNPGAIVDFRSDSVNGNDVELGQAQLDANGTATLNRTFTKGGSYTIRAIFIGATFGNLTYLTSQGSAVLSVTDPNATQTSTVTQTVGATVQTGSSVLLTGTLTSGGIPLVNQPLTLTVNGESAESCSGTTTTSGTVTCAVTITDPIGSYDIHAAFAGDNVNAYAASFDDNTLTVTGIPTTLAYTGPTQSSPGASLTLTYQLSATGGSNLQGQTVNATFDGASLGPAQTDANGVASWTITAPSTPGPYSTTATYDGDGQYYIASNQASGSVQVGQITTAIVDHVTGNFLLGSPITLSATLTAGGVGVGQEPVTLWFGTASCPATTDASGNASCSLPGGVPGPTGPTTTKAVFAGDSSYKPASDTANALVYSYAPGGGSFVVGDQSASGSVMFWGAQWWKQNSLTYLDSKSENASFKGYADSPSTPQCGTDWAANPGNSSKPPAGPLPAYMAVIVTDHNGKSGPVQSGDTVAIVIVQTDSGYKNDPGHAGTGTVVATLCTSQGYTPPPAPAVDCSAKGAKCESLLANPSVAPGASVTAGQMLSILYTDDAPMGSATVTLDGQALPVSQSSTSGVKVTYVDSYGGSKSTKNQTLLSFNVPSGLTPGAHTITVTVQDGDGDYDVYSFTVSV